MAKAGNSFPPFLRKELLKKGGLILLDGLDEVPEASRRRQQLKEAVEDFFATFQNCRVLVTSRIYAYQKPDFRYPYEFDGKRENLKASNDVLRVVRGGSFIYHRRTCAAPTATGTTYTTGTTTSVSVSRCLHTARNKFHGLKLKRAKAG
jgi:hypothetical protein